MLQLTENATSVIHQIVDTAELPEGAGVRIAAAADEPGHLAIAPAPMPEADDAVIEDSGARVFLESVVVPLLDGQRLDAGVDEQGRVSFQLEPQPRVTS